MNTTTARKTTRNGFNIEVRTGRARDGLDHGLTSNEIKFRWITARREEDKFGRIWQVLHKELLSEKTLAEMDKKLPGVWTGGSTIRRGDLVLAFAPVEEVNKLKADNHERAKQQEDLVTKANTKSGFTQKVTKTRGGEADFL